MKKLVLGIDDSGRGPLIGPMVLAGVLIDEDTEKKFKELGVRDSKTLSPKRREFLSREIKTRVLNSHITLTFPSEIDLRLKKGTNLNKIEAVKAGEIINKLSKGKKQVIRVIIDCPSPNREKWKSYVIERVLKKANLLISCEHKADRDHVAVSAASILAKSKRESEISKIKRKIDKDFGSGYPSDPKTISFLKKYRTKYKNEGIFRESWATFKNHKKEKEQKKLLDFK